jgi:hypothetical protein
MKPKPVVIGLAFASLFFAILLPPEAFPNGKMAVLLCATFAFFVSVVERRVERWYIAVGLSVFALLVLHSLVVSVDPYRSVEFITTLWTYYCLTGFFLYAGFDPIMPLAISMVALTVIVSTYGLYQYFWGFEQLARFISHSGSDEVIKIPLLERVATHRVYSTLALPGTLWGFLVMAIPFHAVLWRKNLAVKAVVAVSFALLMATGFLTRSFGFLVGLLAMTLVWLFLHHRRVLWNRLSVVLILLTVSGAAFYSARRGVIAGANPVILRFANWISAWSVFSMNPLGSGLNNFGIVYPRYMLSGANETQYTHNTALQLTSELGLFAVAAGIVLVLISVKKWPQISRLPIAERECVLIALAVWAVHNLIDIDVYFGSVGAVGAVLIGAFFRSSEAAASPPGNRLMVSLGTVALAVVVFSGLVLCSTELQNRAQGEYDSMKPKVAIETLRQARRIMPFNSSLYHDSGQIQLELSQKLHDPQYLADATESFSRAIELSPNKVGPHVGLGLCLSANHDVVGGLKELRLAQYLYPDSTSTQAIVRLMEKNLTSTP